MRGLYAESAYPSWEWWGFLFISENTIDLRDVCAAHSSGSNKVLHSFTTLIDAEKLPEEWLEGLFPWEHHTG